MRKNEGRTCEMVPREEVHYWNCQSFYLVVSFMEMTTWLGGWLCSKLIVHHILSTLGF
jgi:hypothetical protein